MMIEIEFYCCDCALIFIALPDDTGYQQSACPKCNQISMTSEFEGKSTEAAVGKVRFVIIAEFADEKSADPLIGLLERAEIPVQVNLPDVTDGDFFTGGNDNVCVLVPADSADIARQIIENGDERA